MFCNIDLQQTYSGVLVFSMSMKSHHSSLVGYGLEMDKLVLVSVFLTGIMLNWFRIWICWCFDSILVLRLTGFKMVQGIFGHQLGMVFVDTRMKKMDNTTLKNNGLLWINVVLEKWAALGLFYSKNNS
ncbi:unnamed protein product [Vicia faba]|uniref:Transmembrane protein n=1 Tax=Vicia faba TaxID=3906 RepID=A0AAV0ZEP9_VICFA|nr:unnamed protein product [Vicia faba]